MNFQLPTPNVQATKDTKFAKGMSVYMCFAFFVSFVASSSAQQVLDRVVARVGSSAITQTDVDAAVTFGIVSRADALKQLIDRRLILAEVDRFPPPEPGATDIKLLMETMRAAAGTDAAAAMKRTGVNDDRLAELARGTLRIQSYMQQRFGSGPRAEEQRSRWLDDIRARGDVRVMGSQP